MSEAQAALGEAGPETQALLVTRRWIIVVSVLIAGGLTLLVGLSLYPRLSPVEHVVMLVGTVAVTIGLVGNRRRGFLWFTVIGFLVLALASVLAPDSTLRWVPLNILITYATVITVMLASRGWGLVAAISGAATLAALWSQRPSNVIVANLALLGGWVAVLQLLLAGLLMWWAWNGLRRGAREADLDYAQVLESTTASLRVQERVRLWRATAAHLHESVLNSIRYVVTAPTIDRARLSQELRESPGAGGSLVLLQTTTMSSIVDELQSDVVLDGAVSVPGWIPEVTVSREVYDAVRAAAVELTRNAVRHGGARTVAVSARIDESGWLVLRIEDDGETAETGSDPSLGHATVLGTSLDDAGVAWTREALPGRGSVSYLRFQSSRGAEVRSGLTGLHESFDMGRILVTSPLAGLIAGGSLFFIHMVFVGPAAPRLAGLLGLVGAVIAVVIVLRRQRVHPSIALALVLAPAMVPWFLLGDQYTCAQAAPINPVLNVAGYSIMVIAAWSGRLPGVVGLLIWAVSGGLLVQSIPEGCRDSALLALVNSLVALPLIIAVTRAGARALRRAQEQAEEARLRDLMARSTADAAVALNDQLATYVADAEHTLAAIAQGADADDTAVAHLQQLDGRIRAGIQVDPQTDGSVAVMAKSLVDVVTDQGRSVSVRALTCSSDRRPVPSQVQGLLFMILMARTQVPPRLRVFTDGEEDHLSVLTAGAALGTTGLRPGDERRVEDCLVEIEDGDDGRVAILVSRPVSGSLAT